MPKYFSIVQANEGVKIIRPLIKEVQLIHRMVLDSQPNTWPAIEKSANNRGNRPLGKLVQDFERLDGLVHKILDIGVQIKGIITGLLVFPSLPHGHRVYLCWQFGAIDVIFWQEIDGGMQAGNR